MKVLDYTLVVWKEPEGYVSKCPELGVASAGDTIPEAVENLKKAVELYLENADILGDASLIPNVRRGVIEKHKWTTQPQ